MYTVSPGHSFLDLKFTEDEEEEDNNQQMPMGMGMPPAMDINAMMKGM
jgi:hypothetical protein